MSYSEEEIEQALLRLYELGLVKMEYDENLEARFAVADEEKMMAFVETLKELNRDV